MFSSLKKYIRIDSSIRLVYHYVRGIIAHRLSGDPARDMIVIGITGTKGKTTTTNIVAEGLQKAGHKVAMFSTATLSIDGVLEENTYKMTTPSPFVVWEFLRRARAAGCRYAVVETSSHALYFHRVLGLRYDIAVMTNISQDHLDLHGTMENYVAEKVKLFKNLYKYGVRRDVRKVGVVNVDAAYSGEFLSKDIVVDTMYTYGVGPSAQVRAENIVHAVDTTEFDIRMPSSTFHLSTSLRGTFNVYNILAAVCILISQKVEIPQIVDIVKTITPVPGRLESIPNLRGYQIYVDYAHTEDSLKNVLETIHQIQGIGRVITVFGATGDRDKTKRPKMGKIVSDLSDIVILTDDDTYTEDSLSIIRDVAVGIPRTEGENYWMIPDRTDAIRTALIMARPTDVLLFAGKGAESVMITQAGPIPWSDKGVIERILMEIEAQVMVV